MVKQILFASREAGRALNINKRKALQYIGIDLLYLIVISLNLVLIFNINYLLEVNTVSQLENPVFISFFNILKLIENYRYLVYFSLMMFIVLYFHINVKYLMFFLKRYRQEIGLIIKIKGREKTSKLPLIYLSGMVNLVSGIAAWVISYLFYKICNFMLINLTMLEFVYFRITLFILLMLISVGTGILVTYYLFWRVYHY
jgi:hypothetical protein